MARRVFYVSIEQQLTTVRMHRQTVAETWRPSKRDLREETARLGPLLVHDLCFTVIDYCVEELLRLLIATLIIIATVIATLISGLGRLLHQPSFALMRTAQNLGQLVNNNTVHCSDGWGG